jgi:hypothetical protein
MGASERLQASLVLSDIQRYRNYMPDRSRLFELENMLQEIGLIELLLSVVQPEQGAPDVRIVVDVGGGNGYLAYHARRQLGAASMLGDVKAVVIDPFHPAHSIDNPMRETHWSDVVERDCTRVTVDPHPIHRIVNFAHKIDWDRDVGKSTTGHRHVEDYWKHTALVSKHLCGTAIDCCLAWLDLHGRLPAVMVLSPCCYNKGRRLEYMNQSFLGEHLGVTTDDAWSRLTKLTDWNYALLRHSGRRVHRSGPYELEREWNYSMSDVIHAALDVGRLSWLRNRGYDAQLVSFVPGTITPKNVAIVAVRRGHRMLLPA